MFACFLKPFSSHSFFTTHAKIYYFILFSQENHGKVPTRGISMVSFAKKFPLRFIIYMESKVSGLYKAQEPLLCFVCFLWCQDSNPRPGAEGQSVYPEAKSPGPSLVIIFFQSKIYFLTLKYFWIFISNIKDLWYIKPL